MDIQDQSMAGNGLRKTILNSPAVCCYSRNLENISGTNPAFVLLHGYPQSAYIWRHMIPLLPKSAPLFIPDLPGYGNSEPPKSHDKLSVGLAALSAFRSLLEKESKIDLSNDVPILILGHDRGARIAHRIGVSGAPHFRVLGVTLMDIVPTITQWESSAKPPNNTGYFHWPFLANVDFATKMITAYGGDKFIVEMIERWAGNNPTGLAKLKDGDSFKVYGASFTRESVIRATCEDYAAGAGEDVDAQVEDQRVGKKLEVPVLLVYSADYIGSRFDFKKEWAGWVGEGVEVTPHPLLDGIGHFGPEEAPEETTQAVLRWSENIVSKS